jgi:hypothetical protein
MMRHLSPLSGYFRLSLKHIMSSNQNTIYTDQDFAMGKAVVGEFKKTCHPRNVEVYEVREMSFQEQRTCEDLES